jgi:hypothetical protein
MQLVLKVVEATPFKTQSYLTTPVQVWPASTVMSKPTFSVLTPLSSILVGASNRFGVLRLTLVKPASCRAVTVPKSNVGYDGSNDANAAIEDLAHAGLRHDVEALIVSVCDSPTMVPFASEDIC